MGGAHAVEEKVSMFNETSYSGFGKLPTLLGPPIYATDPVPPKPGGHAVRDCSPIGMTNGMPGSPIYHEAKKNGWALPKSYEGYGFLSYESQPLPTKYLTSAEVLKFRDEAWQQYFTNSRFLDLIEKKFGVQERVNIEHMTKIKLKRVILGDSLP